MRTSPTMKKWRRRRWCEVGRPRKKEEKKKMKNMLATVWKVSPFPRGDDRFEVSDKNWLKSAEFLSLTSKRSFQFRNGRPFKRSLTITSEWDIGGGLFDMVGYWRIYSGETAINMLWGGEKKNKIWRDGYDSYDATQKLSTPDILWHIKLRTIKMAIVIAKSGSL